MTTRETGVRGGREQGVMYRVMCDSCHTFNHDEFETVVAAMIQSLGRELSAQELERLGDTMLRPGITLLDVDAGVMDAQVARSVAREHEKTFGYEHQIEINGLVGDRKKFEVMMSKMKQRQKSSRL